MKLMFGPVTTLHKTIIRNELYQKHLHIRLKDPLGTVFTLLPPLAFEPLPFLVLLMAENQEVLRQSSFQWPNSAWMDPIGQVGP